jgi:hypothetical protein
LLDDDVPIVSKRSELFFGRLHNSMIPEIRTTCEIGRTFNAVTLPPDHRLGELLNAVSVLGARKVSGCSANFRYSRTASINWVSAF